MVCSSRGQCGWRGERKGLGWERLAAACLHGTEGPGVRILFLGMGSCQGILHRGVTLLCVGNRLRGPKGSGRQERRHLQAVASAGESGGRRGGRRPCACARGVGGGGGGRGVILAQPAVGLSPERGGQWVVVPVDKIGPSGEETGREMVKWISLEFSSRPTLSQPCPPVPSQPPRCPSPGLQCLTVTERQTPDQLPLLAQSRLSGSGC